jgi:hypothetical protein
MFKDYMFFFEKGNNLISKIFIARMTTFFAIYPFIGLFCFFLAVIASVRFSIPRFALCVGLPPCPFCHFLCGNTINTHIICSLVIVFIFFCFAFEKMWGGFFACFSSARPASGFSIVSFPIKGKAIASLTSFSFHFSKVD